MLKASSRTRAIYAAVAGILVALALVAGFSWGKQHAGMSALSDCTETLIDPALCSGEARNQVSYQAFRRDLEDHLTSAKASGAVAQAAIYFRDLHNGPTLAINANEPFLPMSLMKMPLMIAVLKYAEGNPGVLAETVHTPPQFATNVQVMDAAQTVLPDHDYTIEQLLEYMISYSDNRALGVLSSWADQRMGRSAVIDTLVKLGLMRPQDSAPDATVSARTYAEILRILYSASYLNVAYSQKALDLLTKTRFADGLTHDVPDGVRVAHKFGVSDDGNGEVQLHDCGIVYHPAGPYLLCVMTRGTSYERQAGYIQDMADRVYDRVTQEGERGQ